MNKSLAIVLIVVALSTMALGFLVPVGGVVKIHHVPKHSYGGEGYSSRYSHKLVPATPLGHGYGYGDAGLGYGGAGLGYGDAGQGYGGPGFGYGGLGLRSGLGYGGFGFGARGYGVY